MATYDLTTQPSISLEKDDIINIPYSGQQQSIKLPKGKYKLEAWGAGSTKPSGNPGKGGYASGILTLDEEKTIYIYVGGMPTSGSGWFEGGWNGGGASLGGSGDSGGGGGATDFCFVPSSMTTDSYHRTIRSDASYKSRLLVAGGAGGGYSTSYNSNRVGGYCPTVSSSQVAYVGGMTAAGSVHSTDCIIGSFGYGATSNYSGDDHSGGGGGWYGGGSAGDSWGGGGSSFAWCDTYASYVPSGYSVDAKYKLSDVSLVQGLGTQPQPTGGTSMTSWAGNGYAKITAIEIESGYIVNLRQLPIFPQSDFLVNVKVIAKDSTEQYKQSLPANKSLTLTSLSVNATQQGNLAFNGANQTPEFVGFDSDNVEITASNAMLPGSYNATAHLLDDIVAVWSDGSITDKQIPFTIDKGHLSDIIALMPSEAYVLAPSIINVNIEHPNSYLSAQSSNSDVITASFNDDGLLLNALSEGDVTITITDLYDNFYEDSVSFELHVSTKIFNLRQFKLSDSGVTESMITGFSDEGV